MRAHITTITWRALLFVSLLFTCGCSGGTQTTRGGDTGSEAEPVTITIVALNDFHGGLYEQPSKAEPERVLGGLPWLVGALERLRGEDPELLLLDGGDIFQGAWPVNATRGRGAVEAYNLLGVDAAAIGNHEFDYGPSESGGHPLRGALEAGLERADYAWLGANIATEDGAPWRPPGLGDWVMLERRGARVAVIGLATTETPTTTRASYVEGLVFEDVVETVRRLLPEIEAAGADAIIAIGHLTGGCEPEGELTIAPTCEPDGEIGRLIAELPPGAIDVIVAGHAHTLIAHRVRDTFVVENRSKGRLLGRVELVVTPGQGVDVERSQVLPPLPLLHAPAEPGCEGGAYDDTPQHIEGLGEVRPSAAAITLVARLEEEAGSLCDEVGCATRALTRDRMAESAVGALVTDAMLAAFPTADIAVQNGGGLRADLPEGALRREHIQSLMPFDNTLLLVELTGAELELMLRIGSSGRHSLLQIAGASYHFDPALDTGSDIDGDGAVDSWERDRLCGVEVGGAPLDPEATYRVVVSDFLLGGGDHLDPVLADAVVLRDEETLLRDVIEGYIQSRGVCVGDDLMDAAAPRIVQGPCP